MAKKVIEETIEETAEVVETVEIAEPRTNSDLEEIALRAKGEWSKDKRR